MQQGTNLGKIKSVARSVFLRNLTIVLLVVAFSLYIDVFVFHFPLFAFVVWPCGILAVVLLLASKRVGFRDFFVRLFLGPPVVIFILMAITPVIGTLHDRWIERKVRDWGVELRSKKKSLEIYPKDEVGFINGYRAFFINRNFEAPIVIFDKFWLMRQSYVVDADRFQCEQED